MRPDARGQDDQSNLNVAKFLAASTAHGLPSTALFLPFDLVEASGYSLARVAGTIVALVAQSSETSSPRPAPKSLPAATPVDDQLSAVQRVTEDLEEWVEHFLALTRQKQISDQLDAVPSDLEAVSEPDAEFVSIPFLLSLSFCNGGLMRYVRRIARYGPLCRNFFGVDATQLS